MEMVHMDARNTNEAILPIERPLRAMLMDDQSFVTGLLQYQPVNQDDFLVTLAILKRLRASPPAILSSAQHSGQKTEGRAS